MKRARVFLVVSLLAGAAFGAATDPAVQKEYEALAAKVQQGEGGVDFAKLRGLAAQLELVEAFSSHSELNQAVEKGDFQRVRSLAEKMLAENVLDVYAHRIARRACDKLGDAPCAERHKRAFEGIVDSILKSGDGKSFQTAYTVITVDEEYAVAAALGKRVGEQSLIHSEGHSYDVLKVADLETEAWSTLYFNIDVITAAERKMFQ